LLVDWDLWEVYSLEELAGFFDDGLGRDDAEERALALAGVGRLAMVAPDFARPRFDLDRIQAHFDDSDSDVVKQAMGAYVQLTSDDSRAEDALVGRARRGGGPLQDWEYIRYLRPSGITSQAAQEWLLELATGPISENKFSAAAALVRGMETPPRSLLPEVMALIRSPEYFCYPNLTQFIPKFGPDAVPYLEELAELRDIVSNRIGTAAGFRLAGSRTLTRYDLETIEEAIAAIE
jgi:hypothetical protein